MTEHADGQLKQVSEMEAPSMPLAPIHSCGPSVSDHPSAEMPYVPQTCDVSRSLRFVVAPELLTLNSLALGSASSGETQSSSLAHGRSPRIRTHLNRDATITSSPRRTDGSPDRLRV